MIDPEPGRAAGCSDFDVPVPLMCADTARSRRQQAQQALPWQCSAGLLSQDVVRQLGIGERSAVLAAAISIDFDYFRCRTLCALRHPSPAEHSVLCRAAVWQHSGYMLPSASSALLKPLHFRCVTHRSRHITASRRCAD